MRFLITLSVLSACMGSIITDKRDTSPSEVCLRWAHQAAVVSDTLYLFGGRSKTTSLQSSNTWNNDFVKLDLTKDFDIASAPLEGLPKPDGPPAISMGYLWNDLSNLYLYGGEYSDNPPAIPDAFSLWRYSIKDGSWTVPNSKTQEGEVIERAAEGAGVSVPNKGIGYYFGGHLDGYTTQGWSQSIERLYLTSMVAYDMNTGVWTNHTEEGASFPERADGVLTYIPWGDEGILLALGGGNNMTFSQLNIVDVFDIKNNRWTKQATSGETPDIRVNACAVVFSAPDNSSHNVYMYGGQNLLPYGSQTQYNDLWILSIPAFKWIKVDMTGQSNPPARAGHTCHAYRGQMLVVGGYVGKDLSCDTGVYVFDASELAWQTSFKGGPSTGGDSTNLENQKQDDHFYGVPSLVVQQIGGGATGGATVTAPDRTPVPDSPLTGFNPDYTYNPDASATTKTASPTPKTSVITNGSSTYTTIVTATSTTNASSKDEDSRPSIGKIIGAVIGGIALLVFLLIGGMFFWYKRRVRALRHSLEEAQATQTLVSSEGRPTSIGSYDGPYDPGYSAMHHGSKEDLMEGVEPSFWGMLLSPRRSLHVVNH